MRVARVMHFEGREYFRDLFAKDLDIKKNSHHFEHELPVALTITHKSDFV